MPNIEPFGTNDNLANPLDVGVQTFLGLTVVDVNCTSSWDSQGGSCTIKLIQDTGQYLENVVVGSPQYFEMVDNNDVAIFRFYGILIELSRIVDSSSKFYTATLQSPTLLLEACSLITDTFAGYGGAIEAVGANVSSCLDFGSNNSTVDTSNTYNILNIFGVYENDSYGLSGAGFGRSIVNDDGIRIDFFAYAVDQLLNGNTDITPTLGSNIIYGADGYVDNSAYAYNFDINGFLTQIASYIPDNYRVKATTLIDFVNELCELINHIYYVDLLKPDGAGSPAFASGHVSTQVPTLTHSGTVYGGQIVIITQNRTASAPTKFPLSAYIVGREASDKLGGIGQVQDLPLDIGMTGDAHPDGPPVASSPYGGAFPVEAITTDELDRFVDTNLKVRLNTGAVGARYIVGGFQSRINYVSSYGINLNVAPELTGSTCSLAAAGDLDLLPDVYSYWGEINVSSRLGSTYKNVPVITPIIDDPIAWNREIILIDFYDTLGDLSIAGVIHHGVYSCSVTEIRESLVSYTAWKGYLASKKPVKWAAIFAAYGRVSRNDLPEEDENTNPTPFGAAVVAGEITAYSAKDTGSSNTQRIANYDEYKLNWDHIVKFLNILFEGVSGIAAEHYGKSFAVKSPAFAIKSDQNDESLLNSFTRSWDIAQDAYLDPVNYSTFEAPDGIFINNGRVKAYANYYRTQSPHHDINDATPLWYSNYLPVTFVDPDSAIYVLPTYASESPPSFKNYTRDEVVVQPEFISVPIDVQNDYLLIPSIYFTHYNPDVGSLETSIDSLIGMIIPYNGIGCVPFALVKTKGVFATNSSISPWYETEAEAIKEKEVQYLQSLGLNAKAPNPVTSQLAMYPKSFGIPQQSNRYVYGPWITNISVPYGTKIEYERINSLVPESYILPSTVTMGGITYTITSGYEGMNTVGQLMADTVEGFDFLFTEEASITIADYPSITYIGQALVTGGPLVSDLSINMTASSVTTTYNMTTFAPKFGKAGEWVINRLTKLAKRINDAR
jgi:hypothetical protein